MAFKLKLKHALAAMALSAASLPVMAAECEVDVEATDAMQFNTKEITVSKSCEEFTINLKHTGQLPKAAMGHNIVITKSADMAAAETDGIAAGADSDYVKEGDERVIAHTKLVGGGESDSVKVPVDKLTGDDVFFCSFPGHSSMMKGTVKLVD
ncbi:azurin [Advenella sp. S44]|uniref:azurin n=1 Tax=Advenella sp. S44 TaxID=1982755 RepID=UPI000C2A6D16|nr:azurin [Advenella sp. S44]PJX26183.1 azurin [Advenella sp. S44]